MNQGRTIFSQLLDFIPRYEFDRCVERYCGNFHVRELSCFDQYLAMAFAQITGRESLRDIETCLGAVHTKLYHAGFRARVCRSTLADANEKRNWRIWADFAHVLITRAEVLYANESFGVDLVKTAYAFDSTTIDLCLALFPWARFRKHKAAVKMHTLLSLKGSIPSFIRITEGKVHDVNILDDLPIEPGSFYIMDRGYIDFKRLHYFVDCAAFFVIRAKRNMDFARKISRPVDKTCGLRSDRTIVLAGLQTSQDYSEPLRRIVFYDTEHNRRLVFLTNAFFIPAIIIAKLYKCRWQVELFFKWIKQHLKIKAFFGTSPNAVRTQIWISISVYVLVAIIKKELGIELSLYKILQILSISIFEKSPLLLALSRIRDVLPVDTSGNQLELFKS